MTSAFKWFAGWLAFILIMTILTAISWGRALVYYALWLMVVILLVGSAPQIEDLLISTGFQGTPNPVGT